MKRGISPLLSWVLIIAFAIAMAMLVIPFIIDQVKNINFDNCDSDYYCDDVSISLKSVCRDNSGVLKLSVTNKGDFSIRQISFGRATNTSSLQSCVYTEDSSYLPIKPGETKEIVLSLDAAFFLDVTNESLTSCVDTPSAGSTTGATKITITPWISPDPECENSQLCEDRKIILDDSISLNTNCV